MRLYVFALLMALGVAAKEGSAQVIRLRPAGKLRPQLTLGDTITVTATPSVVNFTLVPKGTAMGSSSVTITTTWSGVSLLSSFIMYGYFTSASAAMSGGSPVANIPTSAILGQVPTGTPTTYTSFTSTGAFGGAGASLQLYSNASILSLGGTRTDVLSLEINLSSLPQQPSATYTGSLFLEVQAF